MSEYKLTEVEEELIEKYHLTHDQDIALYFFNKYGNDILNIIYSKVNLKFSSIPFEREDLVSLVWNGMKKTLDQYKRGGYSLFNSTIQNSYFQTLKEIKKFFKNSELILNHAVSWETTFDSGIVTKIPRNLVEMPKQSFKDTLTPIIEYVSAHTHSYTKTDIKKLLYLKSLGYSEREIAEKMQTNRAYISSMIKLVLKISKKYFNNNK